MVMILKKKPHEVEAVRFSGANHQEVIDFCGDACDFDANYCPVIGTEEGEMSVSPGDFIIKGVKGEFYPVKPAIMSDTFEQPDMGTTEIAMEKHWNKAERDAAPASDWGVPEKKKLRIDDAKHVKLAWDMTARVKGLSDHERKRARARILAKAKKLGVDTKSWEKISLENIAQEDIDAEFATFGGPQYFTKAEALAAAAGQLPDGSGAMVVEIDTPVVMDEEPEIVPGPVNVMNYLFTHLAEEASEITWAACKIQRYGLDVMCPEKQMTGRQMLVKEIAEAHAVFALINEELKAQGIDEIVMTDGDFQAAFDARVETLQREYDLGRYILPVGSDD
jgi:hypothetical protein